MNEKEKNSEVEKKKCPHCLKLTSETDNCTLATKLFAPSA
jgi:hypothetical protein